MFVRIVYMLLVLTMLVTYVMSKQFPVCDTPCRTGGDVATCCRSHEFSDGTCKNGGQDAYCF